MQTGAVQTNSEVTGGRDDAYLHQPLGGTALTDSQAAGYKRDRQCEEGGGGTGRKTVTKMTATNEKVSTSGRIFVLLAGTYLEYK